MNNKRSNWVLLVESGSDEEVSVSLDEKGLSSAFLPLWAINVAVNISIILRKNAANILIIHRMANQF